MRLLYKLKKRIMSDSNIGTKNTGNHNSGNRNSGYCNSGDCNSGNRNSGNRNSGYYNSGDCNSGNRNSGYCNSGDCNSGNHNSGNRNSGYCNSGDYNSGGFNITEPTIFFFGKDTGKKWNEIDHPHFIEFYTARWIKEDDMTADEKIAEPNYHVAQGYLKTYDYKEAWKNFWKDTDKENRRKFLNLPNFDAEIFKEITGIDVEECSHNTETKYCDHNGEYKFCPNCGYKLKE